MNSSLLYQCMIENKDLFEDVEFEDVIVLGCGHRFYNNMIYNFIMKNDVNFCPNCGVNYILTNQEVRQIIFTKTDSYQS